jgi:hypothetical protein
VDGGGFVEGGRARINPRKGDACVRLAKQASNAPVFYCAWGKPAAHPLHRYITYEKRCFSTGYVTVTFRYTGAAWGVADVPAAAAGLAPGGNRRHTRYTVTLPMRNGTSRPVTYRYMPLHGCGSKRPRDYGPRDNSDRRCAGGDQTPNPNLQSILAFNAPMRWGETGGTPVTPLHYL